MQLCSNCGGSLNDADLVCPVCGTISPEVEVPGQTDAAISTGLIPGAAPAADASQIAMPAAAAMPGAGLRLMRSGQPTDILLQGGSDCTIGRFDPSTGPVDIDLGDLPEAKYISRRHARLWLTPEGSWKIADLGSANGTFLRASSEAAFERISEPADLSPGWEIALGNARFAFELQGQA